MYRGKMRDGNYLFKGLMPFGGQLDEGNRWLKIKGMIPWEELEKEYVKSFSDRGRPGLDGRLVIGLFLLKHMTNRSDREVVLELQENVYWQSFCWMENFSTGKSIEASSLTKIRKKLGPKFTKQIEEKTYRVLIDKRIIRAKGLMIDATVIPEKIRYPNDIGLLNEVREWIVEQLKHISRGTGEKIRTYRRKAKKLYLNFAKKKQKSRKVIEGTKRKMLQYVRRNLRQLKENIHHIDWLIRKDIEKRIEIAEKIYQQQEKMYKDKINKVEERIVSWWREYVRPIKRGKLGKGVEFGPKVWLSHVDGFTFLDEFSHENYSEAKKEIVERQIDNYEELFNKKPESLTADQLYGNLENREMLKDKGIRVAFKQLGRRGKENKKQCQYIKRKQRERNRIEGDIGNLKEHYGLSGIRYHYKEGSEMWVRFGLLGKNLRTAMVRVSY